MVREAEQSVLGALLLDSDAFDHVGSVLNAEDFAEGLHRRIWLAIGAQIMAGKAADPITTHRAMRGDDELLGYLNALAQAVPSSRNAMRYAEIVREAAFDRKLRDLADEAVQLAAGDGSTKERLDAIAALFAGMERRSSRDPKPLSELIPGVVDRVNAAAEGSKSEAWPTQFPTLNYWFKGGLSAGKLIVVGARPSVGKSSWALDVLMHAGRHGQPSLFLSQEMPADELADRAVAGASMVDGESLSTGNLTDGDWHRLAQAAESLNGLPVWIDDQAALTLLDIRAKARKVKGLQVMVVDYLQLCDSTLKRENRTAQVGEISRGLKALAKELGICIVALSQLNREVEKRPGKRPQLSDLRDSGEVEQDADAVLFMWTLREDNDADSTRRVGFDVAKNRGGKKGDLVLRFDTATQRWAETTERVSSYAPRGSYGGDL